MPDFSYELEAILSGHCVCGVDEAGRGPMAGPVVAAAVVLDPKSIPEGINDSKQLTAARRAQLFDTIHTCARVGVGIVSAARIDKMNILAATLCAMTGAVAALDSLPTLALVDGNRAPKLSIRVQTIVGGDGKSLSIAAASIIAKVTRDRIMEKLHKHYPQYGFASHKGYCTKVHLAALQSFGPCPEHRMSFAPVAQLVLC